jgi:predicted dehydrogenase
VGRQMNPLRVGIIGCGNISGIYLQNLPTFSALEVVACADLKPELSSAVSQAIPSIKSMTTDELLADPSVDIMLNLTQPKCHFDVMKAGIEAGKHVYSEKPLSVSFEDSVTMMALAKQARVRVGCAPDTFLGAGIQSCRELIDAGTIGQPIAATAFFTCPGHERWHPAPEFYYQVGGGPMLDMGPYYLTALVNLLGPAVSVSGTTRVTHPERTITSQPLSGTKIKVEVATHVSGTVAFANGAVATVLTSFDVWGATLPFIEIYGSEGSLSVPDPNTFGGPARVLTSKSGQWEEATVSRPFSENSRGLGVADMATGIALDQQHRASGELASHVLEIMQAFGTSSDSGRRVDLDTSCERPAALPEDLITIE